MDKSALTMCLTLFSSPLLFHESFEKLLTDYLKSDLIWLENSIKFPEMYEGLQFKFILGHLMTQIFLHFNEASFTPLIQLLHQSVFCHILQTAFLISQYPFVSCSHYIQQSKTFTRQVSVRRKFKFRATVFINLQIIFRILFFLFQQLTKPAFNIQSTKNDRICFCFRNLNKYLQ